MPTEDIIALLIAERDKLNRAIEALQGPIKKRGRPPKTLSTAAAPMIAPIARKKRKGLSSAVRKTQSGRMQAYWAAKRKKQGGKK